MSAARLRFVAVEGVIGAGKTSLCKLLAKQLDARLVLEKPAANPFLPDFYEDPEHFALSTQLHFLVNRRLQLKQAAQKKSAKVIISDFFSHKDRLFAKLNLSGEEWKLFQKLEAELQSDLACPDLVIYLRAKTDFLMERIRRRGISYEQDISPDYISRLNTSYETFFRSYREAPLLIIDAAHPKFNGSYSLEALLRLIKTHRSGRKYFPGK